MALIRDPIYHFFQWVLGANLDNVAIVLVVRPFPSLFRRYDGGSSIQRWFHDVTLYMRCQAFGFLYELLSKLLVSPLITPIVVPYIIPYISPFKEFSLKLIWVKIYEVFLALPERGCPESEAQALKPQP